MQEIETRPTDDEILKFEKEVKKAEMEMPLVGNLKGSDCLLNEVF